MINAGKLNKRITIQEPTSGSPARNAYNEKNVVWADFAELWAEIIPLIGREFWAQQQVQSEVTIKVRIRYKSGVLPTMRVVYGARTLYIKSVIDVDEAHKEMVLMCSEGIENG